MYERFYQLRSRPFALSPDPDFLYPSRVHREALDYLRFAIEGHAGFVVDHRGDRIRQDHAVAGAAPNPRWADDGDSAGEHAADGRLSCWSRCFSTWA